MQPREYDFNERLAFSQGISRGANLRDILLTNIPGAINVRAADERDDRNGTDWWIDHISGRALSVDAKVREEDWAAKHPGEDDLALETYSVRERNVAGWTRDPRKQTDYVLWLWTDTGRWCLVPFPMLCRVFTDHWELWRHMGLRKEAGYKTRRQFTRGGGYHSECVFAPREVVWNAITRQFGGECPAQCPVFLSHERYGVGRLVTAFQEWRRVQFDDAARWIIEPFLTLEDCTS